jgi:alkylhydroperoxidase family enzyme
MARLPYLDLKDIATEHHDLLARKINLNKLLVHSPAAARAFGKLGGHIRFKSKLDPRLRELAILQVGYSTRSPYEYSHHIKIGREFGCSDDDIRAVALETAGKPSKLDALAKTVLRAAREMTNDLVLLDATYAELKRQMDAETLVELVVAISFYNGVVRLLSALQIDVEDDYKHYLDEFPLP